MDNDRIHNGKHTNDGNLVVARTRELTEAELSCVAGGSSTGHATGRRIEKPIEITTPVGTAS